MSTKRAHELERLGFRIDPDAGRLALATPTGPFPLSRLSVRRYPGTKALVTKMDADRWEADLELERMAYLMIYPHDYHLVLRDQLADRKWHLAKNDAGIWRIVFDVPKLKSARARRLEDFPETENVQLGLDGAATLDPHAHRIGFRQKDVMRHIAIWPSTSTEIGTFIHQQLQGGEGCGHYARDSKYASDYHGLGCCAEASSTGSKVARSLIDSLDLIEDGRRWKARDEVWT